MTAPTTDDVIAQLKGLIEFHTIQRGRCVDALRALRGDDAEPRIEVDTQKEGPAMPKLRKPRSAAKSIGQRTRQASKTRGEPRESKFDYAAVAKVASDAHRDGKPMGPVVADRFATTGVMGSWLIAEARRRGHHVPRRGEQAAITPRDIRHETEPIPADRRLAVVEHNEPILDTSNGSGVNAFGFANRPTHVEHDPPETVRNGWYPGKAAEIADRDA